MSVAERLLTRLYKIRPADVRVMTTERNITRKQQAKLTRELFKELGLKGVSVTAPSYANASSVHVDLPPMTTQEENKNVYTRVAAILDVAFPNHDDRSDGLSDLFDFCWSFTHQNYEKKDRLVFPTQRKDIK